MTGQQWQKILEKIVARHGANCINLSRKYDKKLIGPHEYASKLAQSLSMAIYDIRESGRVIRANDKIKAVEIIDSLLLTP